MMFRKPRPKLLDKRKAAAEKRTAWEKARKAVKARDMYCRLCGGAGYDVHHVIPRSRGGRDESGNLVLLCRECHSSVHGHVLKLDGSAKKLVVWNWQD